MVCDITIKTNKFEKNSHLRSLSKDWGRLPFSREFMFFPYKKFRLPPTFENIEVVFDLKTIEAVFRLMRPRIFTHKFV
jgi:hypothetical protein